MQRPIFVAATRQHVGKTTVSLALVSGLKKHFDKVGFLKPVGQQHVEVFSDNLQKNIQVDKDVCLVKEHFHLDHIDYQHMSPVIIPRGYTKKYVDGEIDHSKQLADVENAMAHVADASDIVLCEGYVLEARRTVSSSCPVCLELSVFVPCAAHECNLILEPVIAQSEASLISTMPKWLV